VPRYSTSFLLSIFSASLMATGCGRSLEPSAELGPKRAPVATSGVLDGVPYRIDIPERWNGRLIMLLHGYEPKGRPRPDAWAQNDTVPSLLARGYAVAASAYSTQGWAVAEAIPENDRLRRYFIDTYGKPAHTYLLGASLGSHIALATIEQHEQDYDGALALCGVNLPASEAFQEGVFTPLVAVEALFPGALPLGKEGLADPASPPMADLDAIETAMKSDEAKAALLAKRLEIPPPALAGAIMLDYLVLREMQQRAGGNPIDNRETRYAGFGDDEAFNRSVRRYAASADAARYVAGNSDLLGTSHRPVLIYSNLGDPSVPPHLGRRYAELAEQSGNAASVRTLPPVGDGHCDFTDDQIGQAMDELVKWADTGVQAPKQTGQQSAQ
jgi:pimeloyl-ACP methyl ester carboxylesterase